MLRVKNPPRGRSLPVLGHLQPYAWFSSHCGRASVISYTHEIGILVPFTSCFYSGVTLANSNPLSKIALDRYGFQFLASFHLQALPWKKRQKKQNSNLLFQVFQNYFAAWDSITKSCPDLHRLELLTYMVVKIIACHSFHRL